MCLNAHFLHDTLTDLTFLQQFSTFGTAVNTCFAILLGDISVNADLNQLQGLQGVAATLFFWSFELLVFMVLLNFLLAIIVDAFSEVKENTHETTGRPPLPFRPMLHPLPPYPPLQGKLGKGPLSELLASFGDTSVANACYLLTGK